MNPRFLRTVLHLRLSQIAHRMLTRLERTLPTNPSRWSFPGASVPAVRTNLPTPVVQPGRNSGESTFQGLSEGVFVHLNKAFALGRDHPDWRLGPSLVDRLWTVTLHYHEWAYDLAELAAAKGPHSSAAAGLFSHYLDDWIVNCDVSKPGALDLAWSPYAVATRIGWWVRSFLLGESNGAIFDSDFRSRFLRSLWKQARFLRAHLEWDLLANHLLRDAVGLAWAGRLFDEPEAREWLHKAESICIQQAAEQILPDGGHIERSPMYHIQVMEDFLVLGHLVEDTHVREKAVQAWLHMAECFCYLTHPDGRIALLNDSALNSVPTPKQILKWGEEQGWCLPRPPKSGGTVFTHLGLFTWHGDPWTIFFDVGPLGAEYQLGHGHADTLTIEASFGGVRLLVDPGTQAYDLDAGREYDRSTATHNTITVDGQSSSEVWHIFRCGREARPTLLHVDTAPRGFRVVGTHDGYRHLPGRPIPVREVELHPDRRLVVTDRCYGSGSHELSGGWLLDPRWTALQVENGWRLSCRNNGDALVRVQGPEGLRLKTSSRPYHPEFGLELDTIRLEWILEGGLPVEVTTTFQPQ